MLKVIKSAKILKVEIDRNNRDPAFGSIIGSLEDKYSKHALNRPADVSTLEVVTIEDSKAALNRPADVSTLEVVAIEDKENQEEYGSLMYLSDDAIYEVSTSDYASYDIGMHINDEINSMKLKIIQRDKELDVCIDIINTFKKREDVLIKKLNRRNDALRLVMEEEEVWKKETNNLLNIIKNKDNIIKQLNKDKHINRCRMGNMKKEFEDKIQQIKLNLYTPVLESVYTLEQNIIDYAANCNKILYEPQLEIELLQNSCMKEYIHEDPADISVPGSSEDKCGSGVNIAPYEINKNEIKKDAGANDVPRKINNEIYDKNNYECGCVSNRETYIDLLEPVTGITLSGEVVAKATRVNSKELVGVATVPLKKDNITNECDINCGKELLEAPAVSLLEEAIGSSNIVLKEPTKTTGILLSENLGGINDKININDKILLDDCIDMIDDTIERIKSSINECGIIMNVKHNDIDVYMYQKSINDLSKCLNNDCIKFRNINISIKYNIQLAVDLTTGISDAICELHSLKETNVNYAIIIIDAIVGISIMNTLFIMNLFNVIINAWIMDKISLNVEGISIRGMGSLNDEMGSINDEILDEQLIIPDKNVYLMHKIVNVPDMNAQLLHNNVNVSIDSMHHSYLVLEKWFNDKDINDDNRFGRDIIPDTKEFIENYYSIVNCFKHKSSDDQLSNGNSKYNDNYSTEKVYQSDCDSLQFRGLISTRKLLSVERNPPISCIISSGVIKHGEINGFIHILTGENKFKINNIEIIVQSIWGLGNILGKLISDSGICNNITNINDNELMNFIVCKNENKLMKLVFRFIGNVLTDNITQCILNAGYLDCIKSLWFLSNIFAGNQQQIEFILLNEKLIRKIITCAIQDKLMVRLEAIECICNASFGAINALCPLLNKQNIISDQNIIKEFLKTFGESIKYSNPFAITIGECMGLNYLEERAADQMKKYLGNNNDIIEAMIYIVPNKQPYLKLKTPKVFSLFEWLNNENEIKFKTRNQSFIVVLKYNESNIIFDICGNNNEFLFVMNTNNKQSFFEYVHLIKYENNYKYIYICALLSRMELLVIKLMNDSATIQRYIDDKGQTILFGGTKQQSNRIDIECHNVKGQRSRKIKLTQLEIDEITLNKLSDLNEILNNLKNAFERFDTQFIDCKYHVYNKWYDKILLIMEIINGLCIHYNNINAQLKCDKLYESSLVCTKFNQMKSAMAKGLQVPSNDFIQFNTTETMNNEKSNIVSISNTLCEYLRIDNNNPKDDTENNNELIAITNLFMRQQSEEQFDIWLKCNNNNIWLKCDNKIINKQKLNNIPDSDLFKTLTTKGYNIRNITLRQLDTNIENCGTIDFEQEIILLVSNLLHATKSSKCISLMPFRNHILFELMNAHKENAVTLESLLLESSAAVESSMDPIDFVLSALKQAVNFDLIDKVIRLNENNNNISLRWTRECNLKLQTHSKAISIPGACALIIMFDKESKLPASNGTQPNLLTIYNDETCGKLGILLPTIIPSFECWIKLESLYKPTPDITFNILQIHSDIGLFWIINYSLHSDKVDAIAIPKSIDMCLKIDLNPTKSWLNHRNDEDIKLILKNCVVNIINIFNGEDLSLNDGKYLLTHRRKRIRKEFKPIISDTSNKELVENGIYNIATFDKTKEYKNPMELGQVDNEDIINIYGVLGRRLILLNNNKHKYCNQIYIINKNEWININKIFISQIMGSGLIQNKQILLNEFNVLSYDISYCNYKTIQISNAYPLLEASYMSETLERIPYSENDNKGLMDRIFDILCYTSALESILARTYFCQFINDEYCEFKENNEHKINVSIINEHLNNVDICNVNDENYLFNKQCLNIHLYDENADRFTFDCYEELFLDSGNMISIKLFKSIDTSLNKSVFWISTCTICWYVITVHLLTISKYEGFIEAIRLCTVPIKYNQSIGFFNKCDLRCSIPYEMYSFSQNITMTITLCSILCEEFYF